MPSRRSAAALAAAAFASLTGCASIFTGTVDPLRFDANVPGVALSIDGQHVGTLPLTVQQSRNFVGGRQFLARFEAPGFEAQEFRLQREFNTVAILDISSPLTSGGIDVLTGSIMRFSPTEYHVIMRPLPYPQPLSYPTAPPPASPPGAPAPPPPAGNPAYPAYPAPSSPPPPPPPAATPPATPQPAPPPGGTSEIDRNLHLHQFAAANFRRIQSDVARGGGEHLSGLAAIAGGGDAVAARRCEEATLRAAPSLLAVAGPSAFAQRVEQVLAEVPTPR